MVDSRITAKARSRLQAPRPSAVSASPSTCNAPVRSRPATTASEAASNGGTRWSESGYYSGQRSNTKTTSGKIADLSRGHHAELATRAYRQPR